MESTSRNSNIEGRIVNVSSFGHRFTYAEGVRFDMINDPLGYKPVSLRSRSYLYICAEEVP